MTTQSNQTFTQFDVLPCLISEVTPKVQKLAWAKIHLENKSPDELIFFCVDVKSAWYVLAQLLNKREAERAFQNPKAVSLIWGWTNHSFYELLSCLDIGKENIRTIRDTATSPGMVKYLIFTEQGVDIREVPPKDQSRIQ